MAEKLKIIPLGGLNEIGKNMTVLEYGKDIIIVGCDAPKTAFDAIIAGDMNATIECTPLYGPFVVAALQRLIDGEPMDKTLIHPEEGAFDAEGGIVYSADGRLSDKAADKIGERLY